MNLQITTSDWEAPQLSQRQTNYAAMDALITADMFRQLRVLHQDPDYCDGEPNEPSSKL